MENDGVGHKKQCQVLLSLPSPWVADKKYPQSYSPSFVGLMVRADIFLCVRVTVSPPQLPEEAILY